MQLRDDDAQGNCSAQVTLLARMVTARHNDDAQGDCSAQIILLATLYDQNQDNGIDFHEFTQLIHDLLCLRDESLAPQTFREVAACIAQEGFKHLPQTNSVTFAQFVALARQWRDVQASPRVAAVLAGPLLPDLHDLSLPDAILRLREQPGYKFLRDPAAGVHSACQSDSSSAGPAEDLWIYDGGPQRGTKDSGRLAGRCNSRDRCVCVFRARVHACKRVSYHSAMRPCQEALPRRD